MPLAIFDLDETLINGDCATLWGHHMTDLEWVERASFIRKENELMALYAEGRLAMEEYMDFTLSPVTGRTAKEIAVAVDAFIDRKIEPLIYSDAIHCLANHRQNGDRILIISASAHFLVSAIGKRLGIEDVLAIDLEEREGVYTGKTRGTLTYREGKVSRLDAWLQEQGEVLAGASFYSDSRNDLPLLSLVDKPNAVNPDDTLLSHATQAGWPVLSWR